MPQFKHPTLINLPEELSGPRITLRPYREDDAPQIHEAVAESRQQLRPWVNWVDDMATLDDCRDYCLRCAARWTLRTDLSLGIFETASGRYLGGAGLHDPNWALRAFEIGYWVRQSAASHGYVTEAVRVLAQFALDDLDARRIEITCDADNHASRRVAERAGFTLEGTLRNTVLGQEGNLKDSLVYAIIPKDQEKRDPRTVNAPDILPARP